MADTLQEATDIANSCERVFEGKDSAAVIYALGMLMAHAAAPEFDDGIRMLNRVAEEEYRRQFAPRS